MKKPPTDTFTIEQAARFLRTSQGRISYAIFRDATRPRGGAKLIEFKPSEKGPIFTRAQLNTFAKKKKLHRPKRARTKRRRELLKKFASAVYR